MATTELSRRDVLRRGVVVTSAAGAALAFPSVVHAEASGSGGVQLTKIHTLTSRFHEARSKQDIDLLMSLWAADATFETGGNTYSGKDEIRAFFLASGSFIEHRMAFSPTYKTGVDIHGNRATLYFECHDVQLETGLMVTHLFLAGKLAKVQGEWLFWRMVGGAAPLSVDEIYWP